MGYSHYWENNTFKIDDAMLDDVKKLCEASDVIVVGGSGRPGTKPEFGHDEIYLNAQQPFDGESLYLIAEKEEGDEPDIEFCKTCSPAYDALVAAILIRLAESSPKTTIRSDGTFDCEWRDGRELFERALGRPATCPSGVAEEEQWWESEERGVAYVDVYPTHITAYADADPRCHPSVDEAVPAWFQSMEDAEAWLAEGGYRFHRVRE